MRSVRKALLVVLTALAAATVVGASAGPAVADPETYKCSKKPTYADFQKCMEQTKSAQEPKDPPPPPPR